MGTCECLEEFQEFRIHLSKSKSYMCCFSFFDDFFASYWFVWSMFLILNFRVSISHSTFFLYVVNGIKNIGYDTIGLWRICEWFSQ